MAFLRTVGLLLTLWALDLLLLVLLPGARMVLDPLLLFLLFQGAHSPSQRFLWMQGVGLGLLKDSYAATLFGGWVCAYAGVGWMIHASRHWVEWDDPVIVAALAGILSALAGVIFGAVLMAADPALGWRHFPAGLLLARIPVHAAAVFWGLPLARKK